MSTYKKNGLLMAHFSEERQKESEEPGLRQSRRFLEWRGCEVGVADLNPDGTKKLKAPDLWAKKGDKLLYVDAETKNQDKNWRKMISEGVHLLCRKHDIIVKYKKVYYFLVKEDETELIIVSPENFLLAYNHPGIKGWGHIPDSPDFVEPANGCYKLRKPARQHEGGKQHEDFVNISDQYYVRYVMQGDTFRRVKKTSNSKVDLTEEDFE